MNSEDSRFQPKRRMAERQAYCRACDRIIAKGEEMISWYSHRGQGMYIHLHLDCSVKVGEMAFVKSLNN